MSSKEKTNLTNWEIVSVNPTDKIWNWKHIFCFWANSIQTIIGFSLIATLFLAYNLDITVICIGSLIGLLLIAFLCNLIGKPSQKHGIPFPVILRISMGVFGARYLSLLRGFTGIFMFGVQTFFISKSFSYLIRIAIFSYDNELMNSEIFLYFFMGQNLIDWTAFIIAFLIQYYLFTNGHLFNKTFIVFSASLVYFVLILLAIILFSENFEFISEKINSTLVFSNILEKESLFKVLSVVGIIFAYFSILILNYGDFSRYTKDEAEMKKGNYSLILNFIFFTFLCVVIVLGSDAFLKSNMINAEKLLTNPTDIIGKIDNLYLTIIVLFLIFFASASTNLIANHIPSQNSLINLFPGTLGLKSAGLIILIFGATIGSLWLPFISKLGLLSFVDSLGSFFGPMFGIIIIDYYVIKKQKIVNKDVFSSDVSGTYYYSGGWHLKGLYSLIIGFVFAASTIWNPNFVFLQSFSWIIGALIASFTYYLLASR